MSFTHEIKHLIVGLDVGQKVDRTVLSLLERIQEYGHDYFEGRNKVGKPFYRLAYLERFQLGIPTPQQVDRVTRVCQQIEKKYKKKPKLVIDLGNVGQAHFDEYRAVGLDVQGINYLGDGASVSSNNRVWGVSKKDLASALSVLIENDRLQIPENIPDRKVIITELSKFTWKQTQAGNLTVENMKDSDHDDIPCSLMAAAWFGEYGIREITSFKKSHLGL